MRKISIQLKDLIEVQLRTISNTTLTSYVQDVGMLDFQFILSSRSVNRMKIIIKEKVLKHYKNFLLLTIEKLSERKLKGH